MKNINIKVLAVIIVVMVGAIIYLIVQNEKFQSELYGMQAQLDGQFNNKEEVTLNKSQFVAKEPIGFKTNSNANTESEKLEDKS